MNKTNIINNKYLLIILPYKLKMNLMNKNFHFIFFGIGFDLF